MHYTHKQRMDIIASGKCPCCPENRPLVPGARKCYICRERARRVKRNYRIRHGLGKIVCTSCEKPLAEQSYGRCPECRELDRVRSSRSRKHRYDNKRCVRCNKKLSENELILGKRVCFRCVEIVMKGRLI